MSWWPCACEWVLSVAFVLRDIAMSHMSTCVSTLQSTLQENSVRGNVLKGRCSKSRNVYIRTLCAT